jgi:4-amino-4-deoxy-L-arabinose transferase-like glycosyltransferase
MSVGTTIGPENASAALRHAAATAIGLLLVAGGFITLRWIDEACSGSVAPCNVAIPAIPFAIGAIFGSTFLMARISSRARWGARGALALPVLLIVMGAAQELVDGLLARAPAIPPFPGVTAIVLGVGAAAAVTLPSARLGPRLTRLAITLAIAAVPALLLTALTGDDGPLTAIVALIGVGFGTILARSRERPPVERSSP